MLCRSVAVEVSQTRMASRKVNELVKFSDQWSRHVVGGVQRMVSGAVTGAAETGPDWSSEGDGEGGPDEADGEQLASYS